MAGMLGNASKAAGSSDLPLQQLEAMCANVASSSVSTATTHYKTASTASISPPPSASAASSVFSAPTWWPQLGFRTERGGGTATSLASATGTSSRAPALASAPPAGGPSRRPDPSLHPPSSYPSVAPPEKHVHVAEARAALEASMANILDRELVPRATALHRGERVIKKQQADVLRATGSLRLANQQLEEVVEDVSWKLREVGNLQNWTELLEQRFLAVEETLRLVREGDSDGDKGSCSSCRCSECCSDRGESDWDGSDDDGEADIADANAHGRKQGSINRRDVDGPQAHSIMLRLGEQRAWEDVPLGTGSTKVDPCCVPLPEEAWSPVDLHIACQVPLPAESLLTERDDHADGMERPAECRSTC